MGFNSAFKGLMGKNLESNGPDCLKTLSQNFPKRDEQTTGRNFYKTWCFVTKYPLFRHVSKVEGRRVIIIIIIIIKQTKYYATKILNTETDSKCRLCQQFDETIDHIISACPIVAKEQYIKRHDRVCAQLHCNICKETGVKLDKTHWYEHVPK